MHGHMIYPGKYFLYRLRRVCILFFSGRAFYRCLLSLPLLLSSHSVMSDTLRPHGLKHTRLPCPAPSPCIFSHSSPLHGWCHPTVHPLSSPSTPAFSLSQHQVFSIESALHIWWPKYWSFDFSISPSNDYSELISFRIDWFALLAVLGTLESSPAPQLKSINSLALSFLYGPTLTSIHDYWKNHSFDSTDLCWQCNVSAF